MIGVGVHDRCLNVIVKVMEMGSTTETHTPSTLSMSVERVLCSSLLQQPRPQAQGQSLTLPLNSNVDGGEQRFLSFCLQRHAQDAHFNCCTHHALRRKNVFGPRCDGCLGFNRFFKADWARFIGFIANRAEKHYGGHHS